MSSLNFSRHNFSVDLGGPQMPMPQQFLDIADISTLLQHVGGAASSEGVRRYRLFDAGGQAVFADKSLNAVPGKRLAVMV